MNIQKIIIDKFYSIQEVHVSTINRYQINSNALHTGKISALIILKVYLLKINLKLIQVISFRELYRKTTDPPIISYMNISEYLKMRVYFFLCICILFVGVRSSHFCRNNEDLKVDWFIMYKPPNIKGNSYLYFDEIFRLLPVSLLQMWLAVKAFCTFISGDHF